MLYKDQSSVLTRARMQGYLHAHLFIMHSGSSHLLPSHKYQVMPYQVDLPPGAPLHCMGRPSQTPQPPPPPPLMHCTCPAHTITKPRQPAKKWIMTPTTALEWVRAYDRQAQPYCKVRLCQTHYQERSASPSIAPRACTRPAALKSQAHQVGAPPHPTSPPL